MHYIGGKQKSGGHKIAAWVLKWALAKATTDIVEPFCGGLSVTYRLAPDKFNVHASDACEPLIEMYRAIQRGWDPPSEVSRETWEAYRANPDPHDPMTAFCGFGCSRSGAWFGSFASEAKRTGDHKVPAALAARESLLKKMSKCQRVKFEAGDYMSAPIRGVWYCDKPYADSTDYPAVAPFDHDRFWREIAIVSESIPVLISERTAFQTKRPKQRSILISNKPSMLVIRASELGGIRKQDS